MTEINFTIIHNGEVQDYKVEGIKERCYSGIKQIYTKVRNKKSQLIFQDKQQEESYNKWIEFNNERCFGGW